jgi:hypothetical protein
MRPHQRARVLVGSDRSHQSPHTDDRACGRPPDDPIYPVTAHRQQEWRTPWSGQGRSCT